MAKGVVGTGVTSMPRAFAVIWDGARSQWAVIQGRRRRYAQSLTIQVTVTGDGNRLVGAGVVRSLKRGDIVVTA